MKQMSVALLIWFFAASAMSECVTGNFIDQVFDKSDPEQKLTFDLLEWDWLEHAEVCDVGPYSVAVPADYDESIGPPMLVFWTGGRPVFFREEGSTSIFDPNLAKAEPAHPIVYIWHGNGERGPKRIWYQTVESPEKEYSMVVDYDYDGFPDSRSQWKDGGIERSFRMVAQQWFETCSLGKGIRISGKCVQGRLEEGQWIPDSAE